jgi:P-type conjugative transfer protein TrbJ
MRKAVAAIALVLLMITSRTGSATIPVWDYVNWILSYYQRGQQIANQAHQLTNEARQIQHLAKALESYADGDWSTFSYRDLDALLSYGEQLGYLNRSLSAVFDNTFPGYEPPSDWPTEYQIRVRRTRETLREINRSLRTLSDADSQVDLLTLLQRRSERSDSPLEELETSNMYAQYTSVQITKSIQANLLIANAIAVAQAERLQREASIDAARNSWIKSDPFPDGFDPGEGYGAIPEGWSYTIF